MQSRPWECQEAEEVVVVDAAGAFRRGAAPRPFALALILAMALTSPAAASIWQYGNGNWHTPGGWSNGIPSNIADAIIVGNSVVSLTQNGSSRDLILGEVSLGSGRLNVGGGLGVVTFSSRNAFLGEGLAFGLASFSNSSVWNVSDTIYVGIDGPAELQLSGIATVNSVDGVLGETSRSNGTATIDGTNAKWQMSDAFYLAYRGVGSLRITNGGQVSNVLSQMASITGSEGTALVSGGGSRWTTSGTLAVGFNGSGVLEIRQGGLATASTTIIAESSTGTGELDVSGIGSRFTSTGAIVVGNNGTGNLVADSAGVVTNDFAVLGYSSTGKGEATISGSNSRWTNASSLEVGRGGSGAIVVEQGATLSNSAAQLASNVGSKGAVTIRDAGSTWTQTSSIIVGNRGEGVFKVLNGGVASNTVGAVGWLAGARGSVEVDGAGSRWINQNSLTIGSSGEGEVKVTNGGYLKTAYATLGKNAQSAGSVLIDGAGSKWESDDIVVVGEGGASTLTVTNGGEVAVAAQGLNVRALGTLRGNGKLTLPLVLNEGIVSPGTPVGAPGALTIVGDYYHGSSASLQFELASAASYDKLHVSKAMVLGGGAIVITAPSGFVPQPGNVFDLLDWGTTLTGSFASIYMEQLPAGMSWDYSQLFVDGTVKVVGSAPLSADFDGNGLVDGNDFLRWQRGFGSTTDLTADANDDGAVDGLDLAIWRQQFGAGAGAASLGAAVPEPAAATLLLAGILIVSQRRRGRGISRTQPLNPPSFRAS